jgi:hypothetical protein
MDMTDRRASLAVEDFVCSSIRFPFSYAVLWAERSVARSSGFPVCTPCRITAQKAQHFHDTTLDRLITGTARGALA